MMNLYAQWIRRPAGIRDGIRTSARELGTAGGIIQYMGIRNFWLIKCQRCKEENLSQRII